MLKSKNELTLKKRDEFISKIPLLDPNNLIVIDESGCHLNMSLSYARAVGGGRIKMAKKFIRGTKLSIISAISINSVEAAMYGEWSTDGEIFNAFLTEQLVPHLGPGKIVIMDNVNFHKSKSVQQIIEKTGASIMFLPPYSPELSPIENMWSKLKQLLRKLQPSNLSEFAESIKSSFNEICKKDLTGWFKHCGYKVV